MASRSKLKRELFESDRRVELKMRLALKRAHGDLPARVIPLEIDGKPEREVLGRLIAKVRRL